VATLDSEGTPVLSFEEIDTSIIPPRPRLYGLVGADVIEEVWKARQAARQQSASGNGMIGKAAAAKPAAVH
jgi:succinate dehydrogenase / fumarate reductase flavoprotein subunit